MWREAGQKKEDYPVAKSTGPAEDAIHHRAGELVKSGRAPTTAQAFDLAVKENPMLFVNYVKERGIL